MIRRNLLPVTQDHYVTLLKFSCGTLEFQLQIGQIYFLLRRREGKLLFFRYEGVIQRVVGKVKYKNRAKHTLIDKQ